MRALYRQSATFLILLAALVSCADENPSLVNPPPQKETIRVRFLNLAGDFKPRSASLDGETVLGPVSYGEISEGKKPPADSSHISVLANGSTEFRLTRKLRFSRNNFYTLVALPSNPRDSIYRPVDTVVSLGTLAGMPLEFDQASIRLFNAYPDSGGRFYSLRLGCPNGVALASNVNYGKSSAQAPIAAEGVSVSLIRTLKNKNSFLGLYYLNLKPDGQYAVLVVKEKDGSEGIYLLDEKDETSSALRPIFPEENLSTKIRAINFSSSEITFVKSPDSLLKDGVIDVLPPRTAGDFLDAGACSSDKRDVLSAIFDGDTAASASLSLGVSARYVFMAFDSVASPGALVLVAEPYRTRARGVAYVRVASADYLDREAVVSIAARNVDYDTSIVEKTGYLSGKVIASRIRYGELSEPTILLPGKNVPITIFSNDSPAKLKYCVVLPELKADAKYIIALAVNSQTGEREVFLIDEDGGARKLTPAQAGTFVQAANLVSGKESIILSLPPVLANAKLNYASTLATVLPAGKSIATADGKNFDAEYFLKKRSLLIFAGRGESIDFFKFDTLVIAPANRYKVRYINASPSVPVLALKENDRELGYKIRYGKATDYRDVELERNVSLIFIDNDSGEELFKADDVPFPFGKYYSVAFGGTKEDGSFIAIVVQEY